MNRMKRLMLASAALAVLDRHARSRPILACSRSTRRRPSRLRWPTTGAASMSAATWARRARRSTRPPSTSPRVCPRERRRPAQPARSAAGRPAIISWWRRIGCWASKPTYRAPASRPTSPSPLPGTTVNDAHKNDLFGTARARVGYASGKLAVLRHRRLCLVARVRDAHAGRRHHQLGNSGTVESSSSTQALGRRRRHRMGCHAERVGQGRIPPLRFQNARFIFPLANRRWEDS